MAKWAEQCVQDKKLRVRNKIIHSLPWITIFGDSWGDLPLIFTRDFVTRENHWQITPLVTKTSLFTVTHALFFISTIPCLTHYAKKQNTPPRFCCTQSPRVEIFGMRGGPTKVITTSHTKISKLHCYSTTSTLTGKVLFGPQPVHTTSGMYYTSTVLHTSSSSTCVCGYITKQRPLGVHNRIYYRCWGTTVNFCMEWRKSLKLFDANGGIFFWQILAKTALGLGHR